MTPTRLLPLILLLALLAPCVVAENVTYPQEYYTLNTKANTIYSEKVNAWTTYSFYAIEAIWNKLNAIQIAIETNNKLVAENNALLREQKNAKLQCTDRVATLCKEYAWVGGA